MQLPDVEKLFDRLVKEMQINIDQDIALVGIHTGGVWLAERLHRELGVTYPLGVLDVSFYRDDFKKIGLHPQIKPSDIQFEVEGCHIILVDDVLYTGRTIRAAINELFDYGRPASIRLAALVDRGDRELPIVAEFIGEKLTLPVDKMLGLERDADGVLSLNVYDKCASK